MTFRGAWRVWELDVLSDKHEGWARLGWRLEMPCFLRNDLRI